MHKEAIKMCILKPRRNSCSVYLREVEGGFSKIISVCVGDEKYVLSNPCGRKPTVCFIE